MGVGIMRPGTWSTWIAVNRIHERHELDSAGDTNGIAARDFSACVLRFAVTREME